MALSTALVNLCQKPVNAQRLSGARRALLGADLQKHINNVAQFTAHPPVITRLAYSEYESRALGYIAEKAVELGLETSYDQFGNLHCLKNGLGPATRKLLVGSHIDSVISAGRFDGVVGVVSALESLKLMNEMGITPPKPIEMIAFRAEESTRFNRAVLGSSLMLGKIGLADLKEVKDSEGIAFGDALARVMDKLDPRSIKPWELKVNEILTFLELHIEQSDVLYEKGIPLGLASVIASPERYVVEVKGESTHSGTTPMTKRQGKDVILTASDLYREIVIMARGTSEDGRSPVATVGEFHSFGGSMNQTAESVEFKLDIRGIDSRERTELAQQIRARAKLIEDKEKKANPDFTIRFIPQGRPGDPSVLPPELIELNSRIAQALGFDHITTPSYAGHDSQIFANKGIPTALIFIQNNRCISHNPKESATTEHIIQGTELLFNLLIHLSQSTGR